MKHKKKQIVDGYTLVELLAVMVVLLAVGTIIASILVSSLRSGNKSTTTNDIRQTGNNAIAQMSKMIAYAQSFNSITDSTGVPHRDCVPPEVGPTTPIPSPLTYSSVTITSFDGGVTTFACDDTNKTIASGSAVLIPSSMIASVCYFTCEQASIGSSPIIDINLTLKENPNGHTLFPEAQSVINFQTSVSLRNSGLNGSQ